MEMAGLTLVNQRASWVHDVIFPQRIPLLKRFSRRSDTGQNGI